VVRELIIDSGVPSRGHRRNIFYPPLDAAGVACGPHRQYANMCVMDFAGGSEPARPARLQLAAASPEAPPAAPATERSASGGFLSRLLDLF